MRSMQLVFTRVIASNGWSVSFQSHYGAQLHVVNQFEFRSTYLTSDGAME